MTVHGTLAHALTTRPADRAAGAFSTSPGLLTSVGLVLLGSALTALLAQVSIRLPFTPVPITGQTFAVFVVGAALGSRRGALAMLAYLAEGAAGLPVFAGGAAGAAVLAGPTGGYLLGFVAAAWIIGWFAERAMDRRIVTAIVPFLLGGASIFAIGMTWLGAFIGWERAFLAGVVPFLPGFVIKSMLAALALPTAWKLAGRPPRA